jgi:hypothetical protein
VLPGGMAICTAAIILLSQQLTGSPSSLLGVMAALAGFGAGLGLFIAPNNSATLSAAPADRHGQAGGLLNLMRIFGTSLGVAAASAMLSWRFDARTGLGDHTMGAPEQGLLGGVADGMWLLVAFAVVAGLTSILRGPKRA